MEATRKIEESGSSRSILDLEQVKKSLLVFDSENDTHIRSLILSSISHVEAKLGYKLVAYTLNYYFEYDKRLELSDENITINKVSYYDANDAIVELDQSDYIIDNTGDTPIVKLKNDLKVSTNYDAPVIVRAIARTSGESIAAISEAIQLYIKGLYFDTIDENDIAVNNLLRPFIKVIT